MRHGILVDTGPLYAAVDPHDAMHEQAIEQMLRLEKEKRRIAVPYPILFEAYSMVLRRLGRDTAYDWLVDMSDASFVDPAPEDYRLAVNQVQTLSDQPITLFDATVATMALRMGLEVWTYDHHFDVMRVPVWRG